MTELVKPRKPWVAVLLGFLTPGLGHMYAGRLDMAAAIVAGVFGTRAILQFTGLTSPLWIFVFVILGAAGYLLLAFSAWKRARLASSSLRPYQRWYAYLAFMLIGAAMLELIEITPRRSRGYSIPSGNMMPAISRGDRVFVNMRAYLDANPQRGDIVVFEYPKDPSISYIKRIIGLPGEGLAISGRDILINGLKLPRVTVDDPELKTQLQSMDVGRAYSMEKETAGSASYVVLYDEGAHRNFGDMELTIPENHYFVMGDNRDFSNDSRFWGTVPRENIKGKAEVVYFSWSKEGGLRLSRIGQQVK